MKGRTFSDLTLFLSRDFLKPEVSQECSVYRLGHQTILDLIRQVQCGTGWYLGGSVPSVQAEAFGTWWQTIPNSLW